MTMVHLCDWGRKMPKTLNARLDVRMPGKLKTLVQEAAELSGQSMSNFVISTLTQTARRIVQQERLTVLSDRDRDIFLKLLDQDARPNRALRQAAKWYKKHVRLAD
jgi:uncharacterized protein (DUF1778 family)